MATLQEAIASGRPFRFKGYKFWCFFDKEVRALISLDDSSFKSYDIQITEAISNDWEIKPKEPFRMEFETKTSKYGSDNCFVFPSKIPENLKVKVTIEEIIE